MKKRVSQTIGENTVPHLACLCKDRISWAPVVVTFVLGKEYLLRCGKYLAGHARRYTRFSTCIISLNPQDTPLSKKKTKAHWDHKTSTNPGHLAAEASVSRHFALLPQTTMALGGEIRQNHMFASKEVKPDHKFTLLSLSPRSCIHPEHLSLSSPWDQSDSSISQWLSGCLQWPGEAGASIQRNSMTLQPARESRQHQRASLPFLWAS